LALKEFSKTDFMARCYLDEALAWKKRFGLHAGISLQNTDRKGNISVEDVSLKSTRLQGGMEIELTKGLDLLGGVVMLTTTGNDFTAVRNDYTEIDYFEGVEYDLAQQTLSGGIRYRFQNNIYLCGLYQSSRYDDRTKALPGYTVNQFAIIYNMTF
jgi:hypothetical protein